MIALLTFAWFSFAPAPEAHLTQCRAYALPAAQPVPCRILYGEVEWWALAGARGWDVPPGEALMFCIENVDQYGKASSCGEPEGYAADMIWWR